LTEPLVSAQVALEQLRKADERWGAAVRSFDAYPRRLRTLAEAAEGESRALTLADLADIKWNPRPGASKLRLAYELEQQNGRPGPPGVWARFDHAVKQLGKALEGDSIKTLAGVFEQLSAIARELAEACEQLDEPQTVTG
jgi:hypothetical protein